MIFAVTFTALSQSTTITPGSVLPQMTTAQRTGLANSVNGMMVYDTNTNSYWFYQQNTWAELPKAGSTSNYWQLNGLNGNEIKNTNSGGFWSANPTGLEYSSDDTTNPPTAPVEGGGTRLMWIPSRSAFRAGTITNSVVHWDKNYIGLFSTAFGLNSMANGTVSSAFGLTARAEGDYSVAMGYRTKASGTGSTVLGRNTVAKSAYSTSIGLFNDESDNPNGTIENSSARLFQIGNGSSLSNRSNAMTVLRNGNVGLQNVNNPLAPLHIMDSDNGWNRHIRLDFDPANNEYMNMIYDTDGLKIRMWGATDDFYIRNESNNDLMRVFDNGDMFVRGNVTADNISSPSDRRLKKGIVGLINSTNKLTQLNGYHYHWKAADRKPRLQTGLIAQEVQQLFPELVTVNEDGFLSVNYIGLIPHLIEAVKDLQEENNELKSINSSYEDRLASIEQMLTGLVNANSNVKQPSED